MSDEEYSKSVQRRLRAVSDAEKEVAVGRLLDLWKAHPQLRLGQLLVSPYPDGERLRVVEDQRLLDDLTRLFEK